MITGTFQTALSPIYTAESNQQVTLEMSTMVFCPVLVKRNDEVIDDVELADGTLSANTVAKEGNVPNTRLIDINMEAGDILYAQSLKENTISFTITLG